MRRVVVLDDRRRPNVERMKRHVARSCPDEVRMWFPRDDLDSFEKVDAFRNNFVRQMQIKHPDHQNWVIQSFLEEDIDFWRTWVTMKIVKKGR